MTKAKLVVLLVLLGFIICNFAFFVLIAIGGMSMAVVEGVADPSWSKTLYDLWISFLIPYVLYTLLLIKNWKNQALFSASFLGIICSIWLTVVGIIAVFHFLG